jgi:hypothetical protein
MNATAIAPMFPAPPVRQAVCDGSELVDLVDFKWLMVGEGHRVDLDRLSNDGAYAGGYLALARRSASATLRATAARLTTQLTARLVRAES